MSTGQGRAKIEFEADASGVSNDLVAKMTAAMDRIAAMLEKGFSQGGAKAEASMDGIGASAEQAGRKVEQAGASAKKMGDDTATGAQRGKTATDGMSSAMDAVATTAANAADASTKMGTAAVSASRAAESAELKLSATRTKATRDVSAAEAALKSARSTGDTEKIAAAESRLGEIRARATASVIDAENRLEIARTKASSSAVTASQKASAAAAKASAQTSQAATSAAASIGRTSGAAEQAAGKMAKVGSSGRAGFDGASSAAQGLIGKIGGITLALGAVMGPMAMLKGGFDRLMNLQRAEIMFQNIGLSAQETKDHMARLTDQVTGTSVSLSDAAKYSAMFAQSGVEMGKPMDDSIAAFTSLSSIAEGSGVDVGRVLQQISANGTVTGEDLAQMSDAGVNASKYLADSMGIAQSDIKKAVSDGKVTFEDFVTAINHGTGDLAKQMGQTLPAKISNLKTSVSSLGAFLIEPFIGPLTTMVEFGTSLFKNVKAPLSQFQDWLSGGTVAADAFKIALAAIGSAAIIGMIVGLAGKISLLTKVIGFAKTAWSFLNLAFLFSPIGLIVAAIGGLVAAFVILWNKSDAFRAFWTGLWDAVVEKVTGVVDTLKAAWNELTAVFSGGDDGYGALASLIGEDAAKWVLDTIDTVRNAWTELTTAFRGGDDGYGALASLIGEDTAEWAVNALANVKTAWTELTAAFTGGDDGYGALSAILGDGAAETVVNAVAGIGDALRQAWDTAREFGTTLLDAIGGLLPVVGKLLGALGGALWETIKSLVGAFMQIAESVWGLVQAIAPVLLPILKVVAGILGGAIFVAIKALTVQFKVIAEVVKVAAGVFTWLIDNILGPLVSFLIDVVAAAFTTLIDIVVGVATGIGDAFTAAWGFLQAAWDTVGRPVLDVIVGAFQFWWDAVSLIFRLMGAYYEVLLTGLGKAWNAIGQPVVDFIVAAFQFWWDGIKIIFGWVQDGWNILWAGVRAVYDAVIAPVVGWIKDRFEDLRAGIAAAMDRVRDVIQRVADRVLAFYAEYVQPMVDRVIRGFTRILDTVTGWKDSIVGALSGAGSWLWDTGRNIVQGLLDGIKSLAGAIGSAFLDTIPGWIKDPFKKALGIASPSKVFAGFGGDIGQGLINGLQAMQGKVEGALGGITSTATAVGDELRDSFAGGDSGYAALGSVIGDDLANTAVNATAGAGQVASTAGIAASEATTAFQGGDDGYGAAASLLGEDAGKAAIDVSAQIGGAFTAAGAGIDAAKTGLIDPALAGMQENLAGLGAAAGVQGAAVTAALTATGAGIVNAKTTLVDPALAGMQAGLAQTALTTQQQMVGLALPAMQQTGAGVQAVQTGMVDPALAGMRGAIGNTQSAFASGTAGINAEFNKVREGVAAPTRYAIGPVFNDGLVGMWNGVAEMVGLDKMGTHPINFWSGGVLPGYTPGVDPYTFVEPRTGMTIGLGGGEAIMRPEWTRAVGPAGVEAMNAAARSGGTSAVRRLLAPHGGNDLQFADGGIYGGAHIGNFSQGAVIDSMTSFVNRFFPALSLTSGWRFTDNGYHSRGLAGDYSNQARWGPPTPASMGLANAIYRNFAGQTAQLIHAPQAGWQNLLGGRPHNYGATTDREHNDHVHWALERPLMAAGVDLDLSTAGGAIAVDPREIVESMMGDDIKRVKDVAHGFQGAGGAVDALPGKVHDAMVKPMMDTLVKAFEEFGGDPGGAGVARWRPLAMQALSRMGFDPDQYIDAMLKQIEYESSGEPNSINLWDSNALAGHPSGGLLHVIEPTYRRVRSAYPDAFKGLPDDRMHPLTNLTAGVGAVTMDWGGPGSRWPTRGGYDQGGIANGMGFLQKKIVDPERVLNPAQTKAFEAWMAAGQRFDEINDLVTSVQAMKLDRPEVMADEIGKRVADWIGTDPSEGSLRALAAVLQSGVEWERVTQGMQASAEAWANGDWVRVAEDKRLATPDEMRRQVEGNFLTELSDELGGLIGLKGLVKAPQIVGDTGLVTLPKDTADTLAAAVSTPDGATTVAVPTGATSDELTNVTRINPDTTTGATAGRTDSGEQVVNVEMTVNVNGVTDPMAVSNTVISQIKRGLETSIGGQVRSQ